MATKIVTLCSVDEYERLYFPLSYQNRINEMKDNDSLGIAVDFLGEVKRRLPKKVTQSNTQNRSR